MVKDNMCPTKIIIHHSLTKDSGTVSAPAIIKWHEGLIGQSDKLKPNYNKYVKDPMDDGGYNWYVENVSGIYMAIMGRISDDGSWRPGAHTKGNNYDSIGICFVGNFDQSEVPPEQWLLGIKLVRWLMVQYHIPAKHIYGHHHFATYKSCPGKNFNIDNFRLSMLTWDRDRDLT